MWFKYLVIMDFLMVFLNWCFKDWMLGLVFMIKWFLEGVVDVVLLFNWRVIILMLRLLNWFVFVRFFIIMDLYLFCVRDNVILSVWLLVERVVGVMEIIVCMWLFWEDLVDIYVFIFLSI